jgi:hypothetical protein
MCVNSEALWGKGEKKRSLGIDPRSCRVSSLHGLLRDEDGQVPQKPPGEDGSAPAGFVTKVIQASGLRVRAEIKL